MDGPLANRVRSGTKQPQRDSGPGHAKPVFRLSLPFIRTLPVAPSCYPLHDDRMSETPSPSTETQAAYRVLARKYRPSTFEDLIGQEPMVQTLTNAFRTGRIAQAYMLTGVRGVGKTTTARILARALNYERDGVDGPSLDLDPPGVHCQSIMEGNHVDVIEMDAASHTGIDDIREIIASVRYSPTSARFKVYIIDEVHMLSKAAFNGLLKTLEEPPEHVKFIFATTEIRKVPITVLSRCQRFDLRRIDAGEMTALLSRISKAENVPVEDEALSMIARASEGSARDALSLLDQAIAHSAGSGRKKVVADEVRSMLGLADRARVIDLFEHVMAGRIAEALGELKDQYDSGAEPATVLGDLAEFVHFVTRVRYVDTALNDPALSQTEKERGKEFADKLSPRILGRAWQMLLKGIAEVQGSPRPLAAADMVLVRMTHAADLPPLDEALKTLSDGGSATITRGVSAGAGGASGGATAVAATPSRMAATSARTTAQGGSSVPQMRAEPAPQPQPNPALAYETIATFEDLLAVAEKKRDIRFKLMLRNHVSLISFEQGRIELSPVGDAPRDLMNQMSARLKEWTGDNWMISISQEAGAETVKQREEAQKAALVEDAEQHPLVSKILATFPQSKIVDVRMLDDVDSLDEAAAEAAALDNPDDELADEISGDIPDADGMDDYFR